jgi:hypothetical protein
MLKMSKEEFDRLIETSPNIPEKIVQQFKANFFKQDSFDKIIKPEICDILIPTSEYRNPWFNEDNQAKTLNETLKSQIIKQNKIKKENELNRKSVNDFIRVFNNLNNREPMESEIIDNLKDKMDIKTIQKIIDQNKSITVRVDNNESVYDLNIV